MIVYILICFVLIIIVIIFVNQSGTTTPPVAPVTPITSVAPIVPIVPVTSVAPIVPIVPTTIIIPTTPMCKSTSTSASTSFSACSKLNCNLLESSLYTNTLTSEIHSKLREACSDCKKVKDYIDGLDTCKAMCEKIENASWSGSGSGDVGVGEGECRCNQGFNIEGGKCVETNANKNLSEVIKRYSDAYTKYSSSIVNATLNK